MTPDEVAEWEHLTLQRLTAAQIEEGKARFRARYLAWKQQRAMPDNEPAKEEELPHGE